ncbi:Phage tail assembly chaperone protein, E, or 41 or 14 [Noviherbaspirillum humi]|uniref:Phage tail assembly chaperone protein, E, or 41 or 14 n=1 Tax=Noviherbaspirillum humi TaxID=1688639 RepID=A0A239LH38_9BURK|nr:phage tail assembly protein [Noviherbaspirillum humi]SNT28989.1 Phage tail assembly chaperone protein, E, or 41 or 14 [Noviherbaspirillum humi]
MKTYTLSFPVNAPDGGTITELTLRRLKAKEMKAVDLSPADGKVGGILKYVAIMSNVPLAVMDELDAADALQIVGEAADFLAPGTGATPSS